MRTSQWSDPQLVVPSDPSGKMKSDASSRIQRFHQSESLVGRIIENKYKVEKLLGQGGMALVYKAFSLQNGRPVAIKTLKYNQPDLETRFAKEISIHSELKQENIVEAVEVLTIGDTGQSCFVMEYLEGLNLEDLIVKFKRLNSIEDFATVTSQILDALEYAHFHGFIHRDIKPENIIVVKQNGKKVVKVLDFGLAKIEEDLQKLTKTGVVLGSPTYMSPEQCSGGKADARTDIYSFGVVAYELITGSPPYLSNDSLELMKFHCDESIVPPPISMHRHDLPAVNELDKILQKALKSDKELRQEDVYELKTELSHWWKLATNGGSESPYKFITSKDEKKISLNDQGVGVKETAALEALIQKKLLTEAETYLEEEREKGKDRFAKKISLKSVGIAAAAIVALVVVFVAISFLPQSEDDKSGVTEAAKEQTTAPSEEKSESLAEDQEQDAESGIEEAPPQTGGNKRVISAPGSFEKY